jgi:hypothetical protein
VTNAASNALQADIAAFLQARPGKARFVPEILAALTQAGASAVEVEMALGKMERAGTIIVRANYCADPHLEGVDLRVASLVEGAPTEGDPQSRAIAAIEATWQRWVGEYLANHRCG